MNTFDITPLVPNFLLGDKNGWALAKAVEAGIQILLDAVESGVGTALDPDKMPEWRLDELARDESLFWYDYDASLNAKREMIKSARQVYAMLGTRAGTQRAAQDYASDAKVQEWYEYGGEPAHFRIYSRMGEAAENAQAMAHSVNSVKRLSAVLEGIFIDLWPLKTQLYAGLALYCACKSTLTMAPYTETE